MRKETISKQDFERILHGNRSIPNKNYTINETVQFWCENWQSYSYPIDATIKSIFLQHNTVKTTAGIRTSNFPF